MAGKGGIFHLSNGYSVGSFVTPLGCKFTFKAELMAVVVAVRYAIQFNCNLLWIESDSVNIVRLI